MATRPAADGPLARREACGDVTSVEGERDMSQAEYTIEELLANYKGEPEYVRGPEGDLAFRKSLKTNVLQLTDESLKSDTLTPDEADDVIAYYGWNIWDVLGTRATEGENGLIPRQEYEALSTVEYMTKFPELWDLITEEVGGDGVIEIGATARREIGTKVNALHVWCAGASFVTGRGITMGLGHFGPTDRAEAIARAFQFNRRLARGMWGDEGGMFASQRNYRVPLLEGTPWLERFRDEAVFFDDPAQKALYTKFNATAQLLVFLLHFDNRLGLGDSGPYPTEDGGFLIVRDHFLNDPAYHWFDVADELPHCITQAMYFKPPPEMKVIVNDLSTTFTQPASYIPYMTGMAVYARDKWDTPDLRHPPRRRGGDEALHGDLAEGDDEAVQAHLRDVEARPHHLRRDELRRRLGAPVPAPLGHLRQGDRARLARVGPDDLGELLPARPRRPGRAAAARGDHRRQGRAVAAGLGGREIERAGVSPPRASSPARRRRARRSGPASRRPRPTPRSTTRGCPPRARRSASC